MKFDYAIEVLEDKLDKLNNSTYTLNGIELFDKPRKELEQAIELLKEKK